MFLTIILLYQKSVYFCIPYNSMENKNNELSELFKNIQLGLKQYNVKEFNEIVLRTLKTKTRFDKSEEVNYIVSIICEQYKISKRNFMTCRLGGNTTEARSIASCLFHFNLGLSQRHIAHYYSVSPRIVNIAIKKYRNLDTNIKWDKEFKDNYDLMQAKFNRFLENKIDK
jgi:chromosomal replication initiation ATPase DnaA